MGKNNLELLTKGAKSGSAKTTKGKKIKAEKVVKEKKPQVVDTPNKNWINKEFGGRKYFDKEYKEIDRQNSKDGKKITSFQILAILKNQLLAEPNAQRYKDWWTWVKSENPEAKDIPLDLEKNTTKKTESKEEDKDVVLVTEN